MRKKIKSELQDEEDQVITPEVIKKFYDAILDSPELYPYFMELRPNGLWRKCNKMASFFTRVLHKEIITPADTQHLKTIHHCLNINESSYGIFTRLFAHICCGNKSDARRKKMLSMFSMLKAHICPNAGGGKNLAAFCQVISKMEPVPMIEVEDVDGEEHCTWMDSFPEPSDNSFLGASGELFGRSEILNEQAWHFHLRKRLRKMEKLIKVIQNKSKGMEIRVAKLEINSRQQQNMVTNQQRNLDLVYS